MTTYAKNAVCAMLSVSLLFLPCHTARAGMIATGEAIESSGTAEDRQVIDAFLSRADVRLKLQELGVGQKDAERRVAAMSAKEIAELSQDIRSLPAGGAIGIGEFILIIAAAVVIVYLLVLAGVYMHRRSQRTERDAGLRDFCAHDRNKGAAVCEDLRRREGKSPEPSVPLEQAPSPAR